MDKKYTLTIRMDGKTEQEIREKMDDANVRSLNAFVLKAIDFYLGYLRNEKNIDYIAPILSSVMKSQMVDIEKNMAEIIFKLAVEVAKQNHLLAMGLRIDEEELVDLNDRCCRDVASNNGRVQFENAYHYQHGEDGEY